MNTQAQELDRILGELKAKGATPQEMSTVAKGFLNQSQSVTPPVSAPTVPAGPATGTIDGDNYGAGAYTAGKIGEFLGISKFGKALGRTINNVTGGTEKDLHDQIDALNQSNDAFVKILRNSISSPEQKAHAMEQLKANNDLFNTTLTRYNDISTGGLSNKEVLGSAANTALLLATPGMPSGVAGLTGKAALGAKAGIGAATGYAYDVANKANNNEQNIFTPGFGTAIGAALPFAGALVSSIAKKTAGQLSGSGETVIQRAIDNPDVVSEAVAEFAKNPEAKQTLVDRAKSAISDFLYHRNKEYGQAIEGMTSKIPLTKEVAVKSFTKNVSQFGGFIDNKGNLVFNNSALTGADKANLQSVWKTIKEFTDFSVSPSGKTVAAQNPKLLDNLRQAVTNHMEDFKLANNPRVNVALAGVESDIQQYLSKNVDGYSQTLAEYGKRSQIARNLTKELGLSGNAKPSTQLAQIMKVFKKDPQVMSSLVKTFGQDGAEKFLNDISGAILSEWMPAGKIGNYFRAGGEAGALLLGLLTHNPGVMGATGVAMAGSSPKVVGKVATTAGKAARAGVPGVLRKLTTLGASKI